MEDDVSTGCIGLSCVYRQKNAGGMGLKDFNNFNLAMLGKQDWKMISDPNVLVTKIQILS